MADSVVKGYLMVAYWSSLLTLFTLLRGYLGFLGSLKVLGLLNVAVVLTLRDFLSWTPLKTFFLAFKALSLAFTTPAFALAGAAALAGAGALAAGFFALGAMSLLVKPM